LRFLVDFWRALILIDSLAARARASGVSGGGGGIFQLSSLFDGVAPEAREEEKETEIGDAEVDAERVGEAGG
jgi:hypothetical protein